MLTLRFDGLFRSIRGNVEKQRQAGFMCYGWIITDNGRVLAYGHGGFAGRCNANSNVAEYLALVEGLDALLDLAGSGQAIQVYGDAKSVIEQMCGVAEVNTPYIRPLHRQACHLAANFSRVKWIWRPRRENHAADSLTRRALRQMRLDQEKYQDAIQAMLRAGHRQKSANNHWHNLLDLRIYQPGNRLLQIV